MKHSTSIKFLLLVSGTIALIIGSGITFFPVAFQSLIEIYLDSNDSNLLSETRAPGGALLIVGSYILIGIFQSKVTRISLLLSTLVYFGYAFGRTVGLLTDGLPNQSIIIALVAELIIGALSLISLTTLKNKTV